MSGVYLDLRKKDPSDTSYVGRTLELYANMDKDRGCVGTWVNEVKTYETYNIQIVQKDWELDYRFGISGKQNCTSYYKKFSQFAQNKYEFKNISLWVSDPWDESGADKVQLSNLHVNPSKNVNCTILY